MRNEWHHTVEPSGSTSLTSIRGEHVKVRRGGSMAVGGRPSRGASGVGRRGAWQGWVPCSTSLPAPSTRTES